MIKLAIYFYLKNDSGLCVSFLNSIFNLGFGEI
jgi:hypothetical protein